MKPFRIQIKRAMILLTAVLSLLIVIVLLKTLRLRSKQIQVPPITPVVLDETGCANRLGEVIQFETIADDDPERIDREPFLALHEYLHGAFPRTHEILKREAVGQRGLSLLYTWQGTKPSAGPFLLMSHIDVVPVERDSEASWTHPPFGGHVADGYVWGRGALDVANYLEVIRFFIQQIRNSAS